MKLARPASRSEIYFKQLKGVFFFRLLSVLSSFIAVPIVYRYLGPSEYGVWATIISITSWVLLFDLGVANGLRNRITESISNNNFLEAKEYISTAYCIIGIGIVCVILLFYILNEYLPWARIFNTNVLSNDELKLTVNVSMFFILINFFLSLINQVLDGMQKSGYVGFNQFLSNVLSLLFVYALSLYTNSSIVSLAVAYGFSVFLSNMVISAWFYQKLPSIKPSFRFFKKEKISNILSLGLRFFIIQVAVIVLFTTDRLIISQLLGPEFVTPYDIVFKLFSAVTIVHGIVIAPLWASYADAFHRGDYTWMRNMMRKQLHVYVMLFLGTLLLCLFAPSIISIWIGDVELLDVRIIYSLAIFVLLLTWSNVFSYLLNGLSETRLQIQAAIIASIINIPLSIFFVNVFGMGVDGVVMASVVSISIFSILGPFKVYSLLYNNTDNN